MKTILAPVDLSPASGRIAAAASKLARQCGGRVVLLHISGPPPVPLQGVGFATAQIHGMIAVLQQRANRRLQALGRRWSRPGCVVTTEHVTGDRVPVILARARALKAKWLVLGSHGHGAAYDFWVGSTTQAVLRRIVCPVLVVPVRSRG